VLVHYRELDLEVPVFQVIELVEVLFGGWS
jgi:hypothetical protein